MPIANRRHCRPSLVAATLLAAALPATAGAQRVNLDRAAFAVRTTPIDLLTQLVPASLGDSLGDARLGLVVGNAELGSRVVGVNVRLLGGQLAVATSAFGGGGIVGSQSQGYALAFGRDMGQWRPSPSLHFSAGLALGAGVEPRANRYEGDARHTAAGVAVPLSVRIPLPTAGDDGAARRDPWRFAPALAIFAVPQIVYGEGPTMSIMEMRSGQAVPVSESARGLLAQYEAGVRLEGLGPLRLHVGWRNSPSESLAGRERANVGLGIAIR